MPNICSSTWLITSSDVCTTSFVSLNKVKFLVSKNSVLVKYSEEFLKVLIQCLYNHVVKLACRTGFRVQYWCNYFVDLLSENKICCIGSKLNNHFFLVVLEHILLSITYWKKQNVKLNDAITIVQATFYISFFFWM